MQTWSAYGVYSFVCIIRNFNGFSGICNKLMESKNRKQYSKPVVRTKGIFYCYCWRAFLISELSTAHAVTRSSDARANVFVRFIFGLTVWIIIIFIIILLCSSTVSRPRQSSTMRQTDFTGQVYLQIIVMFAHTKRHYYYLGGVLFIKHWTYTTTALQQFDA